MTRGCFTPFRVFGLVSNSRTFSTYTVQLQKLTKKSYTFWIILWEYQQCNRTPFEWEWDTKESLYFYENILKLINENMYPPMSYLITEILCKIPITIIDPVLLPCVNIIVKGKIALFYDNIPENVCLSPSFLPNYVLTGYIHALVLKLPLAKLLSESPVSLTGFLNKSYSSNGNTRTQTTRIVMLKTGNMEKRGKIDIP